MIKRMKFIFIFKEVIEQFSDDLNLSKNQTPKEKIKQFKNTLSTPLKIIAIKNIENEIHQKLLDDDKDIEEYFENLKKHIFIIKHYSDFYQKYIFEQDFDFKKLKDFEKTLTDII